MHPWEPHARDTGFEWRVCPMHMVHNFEQQALCRTCETPTHLPWWRQARTRVSTRWQRSSWSNTAWRCATSAAVDSRSAARACVHAAYARSPSTLIPLDACKPQCILLQHHLMYALLDWEEGRSAWRQDDAAQAAHLSQQVMRQCMARTCSERRLTLCWRCQAFSARSTSSLK